jgi:hypothetical protein
MIEPTCVQWNHWKDAGLAVKFVHLDNAGENKKLKECSESADWKLDIEYEFTAWDTPQQNHLAELGFAVLANRGRALMHRANVPMKERYKLFHEAFKTATLLDGLIRIELDGKMKPCVVHWSGKVPNFAKHLRTWGEAGTVKTKTPTTAKLADRGVHCMFVGYALDHAGDVYRMWNPKTGRVHEMRDVIWLLRMYFKKPMEQEEIGIMPTLDENKMVQVGESEATQMTESLSESESVDNHSEAGERNGTNVRAEEARENDGGAEEEKNEDEDEAIKTTRSGRAVTKPTRLIEEYGASGYDNYSIGLTDTEQQYYRIMRESGEFAFVGARLGGGFMNTSELHVMKYKEAMASNDHDKWQKAVDEGHERMLKHNVWKPVLRKDVPEGAKILTSTWAMKKRQMEHIVPG